MIEFTIPGQPVGKGRPRASRTNIGIRMHTPAKTVHYEARIAFAAQQAMMAAEVPGTLAGPVAVQMVISYQIPASWSRKAQERAEQMLTAPCVKPDIDNVAKVIGDACNGIIWRDDVQIVDLHAVKRYSRTPGVSVKITALAAE